MQSIHSQSGMSWPFVPLKILPAPLSPPPLAADATPAPQDAAAAAVFYGCSKRTHKSASTKKEKKSN